MQLDAELIDVAGDLSPLRFVFFELAPEFADAVRTELESRAGLEFVIVWFRRS